MSPAENEIHLVIHGHFYQPPRDNPWLRAIETQESAHPSHDWNEKILDQCYRPNTRSRRLAGDGRITDIVNNLARISFNFGPTLMRYIEKEDPATYRRILDADKRSIDERSGHGNAIAQAYHHVILPLAAPEDRRILIRWGLADFEHRFGRKAEGLWLPEAAIHDATAADLAREGLRFVLLSPYQAEKFRPMNGGEEEWTEAADGSIDPRRPYRLFPDPEDRDLYIDVLFYHAGLSTGISFEHYLRDAEALGERLRVAAGADDLPSRLVHVATDGEVYGHHEAYADMCLAALFGGISDRLGLKATNPGEFLDLVPPAHEVVLKEGMGGEGTAWSCTHGVGRWTRDCGCSISHTPGWNQKWRAPLRDALEILREELLGIYEKAGAAVFRDPGGAVGRYVEVLNKGGREAWDRFLVKEGNEETVFDNEAAERAYALIEMAHGCLRMFTSCGWFFDDIGGIEPSQNLLFAGHAVDLARTIDPERASGAEAAFRKKLRAARSNVPSEGDGQSIFDDRVGEARATFRDWAASIAAARLLDVVVPDRLLAGRDVNVDEEERFDRQGFRALRGRLCVREPHARGSRCLRYLAAIGEEQMLLVWVGDESFDTTAAGSAVDLAGLKEVVAGEPKRLIELPRELRRLLVDRLVDDEKKALFAVESDFFEWLRALSVLIERAGLPGPPWFRKALTLYVERGFGLAVTGLVAAVKSGEDREPFLADLKELRRIADRFRIEADESEMERALRSISLSMLRRRKNGDGEEWAGKTLGLFKELAEAHCSIRDPGILQDEFFDQLKSEIPLGPLAKELGEWLRFSPEILI